VPVCRLKEIIKYGDKDHKQVFVLDDVLGIFAVKIDHIINNQEHIFTTIGKTSKLLFTCRKSVYNEAFKPIPASLAVMQDGELWLSFPILIHQLLS
jgi:hypothetical protein